MDSLRARLRYADVMATLAVFIALGGLGWAATTLPRNSVGTKQLKKNAVTSKKVKDASLLSKDFKAGQLPAGQQGPQGPPGDQGLQGPQGPATGPAGGDLTGTYPNPLIASGAVGTDEVADDSLTGADVNESTLAGVDAATIGGTALSGLAGIGRQTTNVGCGDDNHTDPPEACATLTMTLPRPARVLLLGSGNAHAVAFDDTSGPGSTTDSTSTVQGLCSLYFDTHATPGGHVITLSTALTTSDIIPWASEGITTPLAAGQHDFTVRCAELDGDIAFSTGLTAVALAAD